MLRTAGKSSILNYKYTNSQCISKCFYAYWTTNVGISYAHFRYWYSCVWTNEITNHAYNSYSLDKNCMLTVRPVLDPQNVWVLAYSLSRTGLKLDVVPFYNILCITFQHFLYHNFYMQRSHKILILNLEGIIEQIFYESRKNVLVTLQFTLPESGAHTLQKHGNLQFHDLF